MINFEEIWNLTLQKLTKIYVGVFSLSFYVLCKRVVVRRTQLLLGKKSCVPLEPWTHASTKQREREREYIYDLVSVYWKRWRRRGVWKTQGVPDIVRIELIGMEFGREWCDLLDVALICDLDIHMYMYIHAVIFI